MTPARTRKVEIPIYGGTLHVVSSLDAFDNLYARILKGGGFEAVDGPQRAAQSAGLTASETIDGDLHVVSGAWSRSPSVACHEAVHCAQAVAQEAAMDPIKEVEGFAYLTQWFFDQLYQPARSSK